MSSPALHRLQESVRILKKLSILVPNGEYRRGLRAGVAAAIEHQQLLRTLDARTVLDIGANCGQFALATRACLPDARIHAFEPLPGPAEVFRKVFAGDANVALHEVAIGP